jgi:hypothetical protein
LRIFTQLPGWGGIPRSVGYHQPQGLFELPVS